MRRKTEDNVAWWQKIFGTSSHLSHFNWFGPLHIALAGAKKWIKPPGTPTEPGSPLTIPTRVCPSPLKRVVLSHCRRTKPGFTCMYMLLDFICAQMSQKTKEEQKSWFYPGFGPQIKMFLWSFLSNVRLQLGFSWHLLKSAGEWSHETHGCTGFCTFHHFVRNSPENTEAATRVFG